MSWSTQWFDSLPPLHQRAITNSDTLTLLAINQSVEFCNKVAFNPPPIPPEVLELGRRARRNLTLVIDTVNRISEISPHGADPFIISWIQGAQMLLMSLPPLQ